jgi:hypothetical protein
MPRSIIVAPCLHFPIRLYGIVMNFLNTGTTLPLPQKIYFEDVDWIVLARDRVKWAAVVNTVMNFWIS